MFWAPRIIKTMEESIFEEHERSFRQQTEDFEQYFCEHHHLRHFPMDDWSNEEFWHHYWRFRACVASLRRNPDTKDDRDFIALCDYWKSISDSPFNLRQGDFVDLEKKYNQLKAKPVFGNNPIFRDLYGSFVKGIYGLITGSCPDYWTGFFDVD